MTAILGIGGLLIDVGHAYVVRGELQNYANAAALAAAGEVYNTSSTNGATTTAIDYSAIGKGDENYNASLGPVNTTIATWCVNMLMPARRYLHIELPGQRHQGHRDRQRAHLFTEGVRLQNH